MKTERFLSLPQKASHFILIALLSCTLTLTWSPVSLGQFPFPSSSSTEEIPQLPRWNPNKAKQCGKFWCSEVHVYGNNKLTGELKLGALIFNPDKPENPPKKNAFELEQRAKLIQVIFENIFRNIVKANPEPQVSEQKDWQFWLLTTENPVHPLTPKIEVGIQNQQTVVFVPKQMDLGLPQQTIITVTALDAKVNAKQIAELAQIWQEEIHQAMSNVLWGSEFDRQYPGGRIAFAGAVALIALSLIQIIRFLRRFLRQWKKSVKQQLEKLNDSLIENAEDVTAEDMSRSPWENVVALKFWLLLLELDCLAAMLFFWERERDDIQTLIGELKSETLLGLMFFKLRSLFPFLRPMTQWRRTTQMLPQLSLQSQFLLKQEWNLSDLLLRISWLAIASIILIALGGIVALFRPSRYLINLFVEQVYLLPLIWIGILLADQLTDFFVDYALKSWAEEKQEADPSSNRYTLRANTYSKVFTRGTTLFFTVMGLVLTASVIGIDSTILAGAGALAVVFAYLSRNLVEDIINGVLILATDRYAVGDVIDLGEGFSGLVEDMNLYVTSLRNLDGQVLVIPNSTISRVINSTKDWSRVNFTLKICWNADIRKSIEVMRQVAKQMSSEPQWQEMILEPVDILGIDELSHDGILVHLIIKTLPSKQWLIGREYRLRVKEALDKEGISLGVPQQEVAVIQSPGNNFYQRTVEVGEKEKENQDL